MLQEGMFEKFSECLTNTSQKMMKDEDSISPTVHHYSVAMLAHARNGDVDAVITWLEDMQRSGVQLNGNYTFTARDSGILSEN
jgi:pentatricopeptide repeat protein